MLRDYEDGLAIAPEEYTVVHAVNDWLTYGLSGRGSATIRTNRILCRLHVIPALGARKGDSDATPVVPPYIDLWRSVRGEGERPRLGSLGALSLPRRCQDAV
jgi:hypothetical protein